MKQLFLGDLSNYTEQEILQHFISQYDAAPLEVEKFRILIADESVGDFGCDSSSWFLLQDKNTGELYEIHGSHCSCYGFEGQFEPEKTTIEYLKSEHFSSGMYYENDVISEYFKDM